MYPSERATAIQELRSRIEGCEAETQRWRKEIQRLEAGGPSVVIRRLKTVVSGAFAIVTADVDPHLQGLTWYRWTVDGQFHAVTSAPETIIPTTNRRPGTYIVAVELVAVDYKEPPDCPPDCPPVVAEQDRPPDETKAASEARAAGDAESAQGVEGLEVYQAFTGSTDQHTVEVESRAATAKTTRATASSQVSQVFVPGVDLVEELKSPDAPPAARPASPAARVPRTGQQRGRGRATKSS